VEDEVVPDIAGSRLIESVEGYFEGKATVLERARSAVKKLARHLKVAEASAREGNVGALEKAVVEATALCSQLASEVEGCVVDQSALAAAVAKASFLEEIARRGSAAGVAGLRVTEGKLSAFPYVLEPPEGFIIALGSTKLRSIKPSVVAAEIARTRERSAVPERKLTQAIGRVCECLGSNGKEAVGVSLFEVYELLTPLPGQQVSYTLDDFFAGISKLAASGPHRYNGAILDFPAPGSGARRVKAMVGPDGRTAKFSTVRLIPTPGPLGI
jgi:hypothetical protein